MKCYSEITYASLAHPKAGSKSIPGSPKRLEEVGERDTDGHWHRLAARDESAQVREVERRRQRVCALVLQDPRYEEIRAEGIGDNKSAAPFQQ